MDYNKEYEQKIMFRRLIVDVLRRWRMIIVVGIIFALLLSGVRVVQVLNKQGDAAMRAQKQAEYQEKLKDYNLAKDSAKQAITITEESIANKLQYINNSILMQIDTSSKYVSDASMCVITDIQQDPLGAKADSIVGAYEAILNESNLYDAVAKTIGDDMDSVYFRELVTSEADYDANRVKLEVCYDNSEDCTAMLDAMLTYVEQQKQKIEEQFGPHTFTIVGRSDFVTTDNELDNTKKLVLDSINLLTTTKSNQTKYLATIAPPTNPIPSTKAIVLMAIKYVIVGGACGVLLVAGLLFFIYVLNGKLHNQEEIRRGFDLRILGAVYTPAKKRFFGFVDAWLDRLEGIPKHKQSEEEFWKMVALRMVTYAGESKKILFTGTVDEKVLEQAVRYVQKSVKGKGFELLYAPNIVTNPDAIEKAADCDGIVIIEKNKETAYKELAMEIETIRHMHKEIIGCIC